MASSETWCRNRPNAPECSSKRLTIKEAPQKKLETIQQYQLPAPVIVDDSKYLAELESQKRKDLILKIILGALFLGLAGAGVVVFVKLNK